jgi:hypothetical protein
VLVLAVLQQTLAILVSLCLQYQSAIAAALNLDNQVQKVLWVYRKHSRASKVVKSGRNKKL